jgi:alkanesulfonate monooxygenase SsuD/methylene tetrahydromethanopterin reductase-like flavin-dependent oxidoreductase (luciferase family)
VTSAIRVGLRLTCGAHPVAIAEEAAVADLLLGGRLVLALAPGDGGLDQMVETVKVVLAGQASHPFGSDGPQWTIPARFPANVETETRIRVTPTPAQIEMPVWVTGQGAAEVAAAFGVTYVGGPDDVPDAMAAAWAGIDAALGPAATRLRRPAIRRIDDGVDTQEIVASLQAEQAVWGLDVALLDVPGDAGVLDTIAPELRHRNDNQIRS